MVLKHLDENTHAFFNLLYTAGYLTAAGGDPEPEDGKWTPEKLVRIPNKEVKIFFADTVVKWFGHGRGSKFLEDFLKALTTGYVEKVQEMLATMLIESFSYNDGVQHQEAFYHGFLLGLTLGLKGRYDIKSNRESGYGRYDLALYPKDPMKNPGIIIEVKFQKASAKDAVLQIQDKAYATDLRQHGCTHILLYGLHFHGKIVTTKLVEA